MGPDEFYSMFKLDGRDTGAAYTMRKEQRAQGVPPNWMVYISTGSADQTAAKTAQAGGTVLMPAFDVMDVGRMAVLQDPNGAVFSAWQEKRPQALVISGGDGRLCWADLSTPDPDRAARCDSEVFGWKAEKGAHDPSGYLHIKNGEDFIGGIPPANRRNPLAPPHWMIYIQVADVEATAAKAKQLGAKLHMPPTKMENVGDMAIIADPQGAVFAVFKSARRS